MLQIQLTSTVLIIFWLFIDLHRNRKEPFSAESRLQERDSSSPPCTDYDSCKRSYVLGTMIYSLFALVLMALLYRCLMYRDSLLSRRIKVQTK